MPHPKNCNNRRLSALWGALLAVALSLPWQGCSPLYPAPFPIEGAYQGEYRAGAGKYISSPCPMYLHLSARPQCGALRQARVQGQARLDIHCLLTTTLMPEKYRPLFEGLNIHFPDADFDLEGYLFADGILRLQSIHEHAPVEAFPGIVVNIQRIHFIGDGTARGGFMETYRGGWLGPLEFRLSNLSHLLDSIEVNGQSVREAIDALIQLINDNAQHLPPHVAQATEDNIRDVVRQIDEADISLSLETILDAIDLDKLLEESDLPKRLIRAIEAVDFSALPPPIFGDFIVN